MENKILESLKELGSKGQVVVDGYLVNEICEILYDLGVNVGVEDLSEWDNQTLIFMD